MSKQHDKAERKKKRRRLWAGAWTGTKDRAYMGLICLGIFVVCAAVGLVTHSGGMIGLAMLSLALACLGFFMFITKFPDQFRLRQTVEKLVELKARGAISEEEFEKRIKLVMDSFDEPTLTQLAALKEEGLISEEDFGRMKKAIMDSSTKRD